MSFESTIYAPIVPDLPAQMIPFSQKGREWREKCMDALETVARTQAANNVKLIENYEMVKGRFIYHHYFETEGYTDLMAQLTREFELPTYLRHYDIISQVVNTLSGEYQKRPDLFRVKNESEEATNEYQRTKTDLLHKYVTSRIEAEVTRKMLEQGIDIERTDFESEEEMQEYQQLVQQAQQQLTPPEIQQYMDTKWTQAAEIWGQHQLQLDKNRFSLSEKEKREFEDMLISDRCFRHFYLTPTGYNQETWNPVNVFYHKSPEIEYIEDGDYVGRGFFMSIAAIIDRYGHLMTKDDLQALENRQKKEANQKWNYAAGTEWVYDEYMVPFKGFREWDAATKSQALLEENTGIPYIDGNALNSLYANNFFSERRGMFFVTEGYWMSQMKIGKVIFQDPETGMIVKRFVDENFVVPDYFTEVDSTFSDTEDVNTVVWTYVNQVWKGAKINMAGKTKKKDIYIDIKPLDFQFKGDFNPYGAKLPVCGQIFSVRNSKSMSLVDLMKPYQIFYNVAMNQLYQIMEREIGRFVVWDVNMFPDQKDWGGEKAFHKFLTVAKQFGLVPADTSPANMNQSIAASGGYLPKDFNFDDTARMISRLQLAQAFESMALKQVGFNDYRTGQYGASATAGGIEAAQQQSFASTESFFTNFSNYLKRCHQMNLSIAQYVQAKDKDATVMLVKSDMSRAFIKIAGTEMLTADLHCYVTNSQEYIRQLETLRNLAIENNTTGADMLDLAEVITAASPELIKLKLQESRRRQESMQQQQMQAEQQQAEAAQQIEQARLEQEERHFQQEIQRDYDIAYISQQGQIINTPIDVPENKSEPIQPDTSIQQQKIELDRQKMIRDDQYKNRKLALDQGNKMVDLAIQKEKVNITRIMKNKKPK